MRLGFKEDFMKVSFHLISNGIRQILRIGVMGGMQFNDNMIGQAGYGEQIILNLSLSDTNLIRTACLADGDRAAAYQNPVIAAILRSDCNRVFGGDLAQINGLYQSTVLIDTGNIIFGSVVVPYIKDAAAC